MVEEVTKGGYDFEGLFQAKCLACGSEYDVEPELCEGEGCFSTEFRSPDPEQLEGGPWKDGGIKGVLERPNWDDVTGRVARTTLDLLKDGVYYSNVIGGWHWEVIKDARGRVRQIWSMNSESMRPVEDPSLTMGTWFCPAHREVAKDNKDIQLAFQEAGPDEEHPLCRKHAVPLQRTAWVQLGEGDEIVAIFTADEVLADHPRARGYRIFARSKVLRVWAMGQTFRWQERYDLATFSGQRAPDLLVVVGGKKQSEVNAAIQKWSTFVKANPEYQGVIWIGLGPGESPIEVKTINLLGDMTKRDFVAWQEHAFKSVAYNLGVAPVMMGVETAGKLGQPQEVLQVSYDTIEENQSQQEEFVNGQFMPLFPEVTDWKFVMKPPAPADETARAREAIMWATAVERLRAAGADAKLDPQAPFDWPILIEGWEERRAIPEAVPGGGAPGAKLPPQPPATLTLAQKRWEAFTGPRGGQGARNTETGREVFGEEARRVLAGQGVEPEAEEPEGDDRIPPDQEPLVADVEVSEVRRDEVLGTLEVLGAVPIDQLQAGETEPVDLHRRAEAYAELMRQGVEFPPLVVFGRRTPEDKFQVIDGHARLEAARRAGKETVGAEITLVNPQGRAVKMLEKALTTRNLPPAEALTGIRRLEDELVVLLRKRWDKARFDFRRMGGRRPNQTELQRLMADVALGLQGEFGRLGKEYVGKAYRLGLEEEAVLGAQFTAADQPVLEALLADPDRLLGRLSKVVDDATGVLQEEIRKSLEAGLDTGAAARRAADRLGEELWKVERIVRSATTDIANSGRITQFEKLTPRDDYGFVSARDRRRCPICKAADDGIDTLTAEERAEFDRSEYDPALLHGNPYTLAEVKALWQVHRSFHGNCRCTVRRLVALS